MKKTFGKKSNQTEIANNFHKLFRYSVAHELQNALNGLKEVESDLKRSLERREKAIRKRDFKEAQRAKDEYDKILGKSVDLSKIQRHLTPSEVRVKRILILMGF